MSEATTVLVGDVGGTSVRFALAHRGPKKIEIEQFAKLPGDDFASFEEALGAYLSDHAIARPTRALFALAGPIRQGCVELTNRPWRIKAQALEARFGFEKAALVNDFAAMARAVPEVEDDTLELVLPGTHRPGAPVLVAGAGTGYGVATLMPRSHGGVLNGWSVIAGEGGHSAYAPRTEREFALARRLAETYAYVSNELICSGIGLAPVHRALCELLGLTYEALPPEEVLSRASKGDRVCTELCEIRADAIMGSVGDAALISGAHGGVVLAGGVSSRLAPYFKRPAAIKRFRERGPRSAYMDEISIRLITHETAPLIGAATLHFEQEPPQ